MWTRITDILKTGAAMLQNGKAPPNTPKEYVKEMEKVNFLASKKFFVTFVAIILLTLFYGASVFILFLTAPLPTITQPFVTIFCEAIKIFAIIIASYLGVQTTLDWKMSSNSENVNQNATTNENRTLNENITETKRIIREGDGDAPEIRPFAMIATEE